MKFFILPLLVGASINIHAAACCTSTAAFGVGKLARWENAAVGFSTSPSFGFGYFSQNADWEGESFGNHTQATSTLWGLVGLHHRHQLFAKVPWLMLFENKKWLGQNVGDISFGWRYQFLQFREFDKVPGFALLTTLILPSSSPAGNDVVTGRGAGGVSIALSIEEILHPWFFLTNLGTTLFFPNKFRQTQLPQQYAPSLEVNFVAGVEISNGLAVSLVTNFAYEGDTTVNESKISNSSRLRSTETLAIAWRIEKAWTLQASFSSDIPIPYLIKNNPIELNGSLGIRYGFIK